VLLFTTVFSIGDNGRDELGDIGDDGDLDGFRMLVIIFIAEEITGTLLGLANRSLSKELSRSDSDVLRISSLESSPSSK
jgi:hypothetical protein